MSTYPMTAEDAEIQQRARTFVDEALIPWEQHAEENAGQIPDEVREKHHRMAMDLGLYAMNMPKDLGGTGMTMFQQVLVSEQIGRVTNALGWCVHTPPAWAPAVVSKMQMDRWILPTIRGEMHECYAITEAGAGSDVDAIAATARWDGDNYALSGEKMHVTSYNHASYMFFQAKIVGGPNEGAHAMFFVDKDTPGVRHIRDPRYTHTYPDTHAMIALEDVRVPANHMVGAEGDGMS
ncbi:MAG: acyl-CoA dehydrogenase family protein, partial [Actinomycetota bacterium]